MPLAQASRFAVLKLQDDSSEDDSVANMVLGGKKAATGATKTKKRSRGKKKQPVGTLTADGVLVRAGEGDDSSNGPVNVNQPTADDDQRMYEAAIYQSQIDYENDQRLRQLHHEQQMASQQHDKQSHDGNSSPTKKATSPPPPPAQNATKANATTSDNQEVHGSQNSQSKVRVSKTAQSTIDMLNVVDNEAKQLIKDRASKLQPSETKLINLYRNRFKELIEETNDMRLEYESTKTECAKYKERYKKLCELLKDAEVKEKAQLMLENERGAEQREELSEELQELHGTVEQQRSKIHELEQALRKAEQVKQQTQA